MHDTNPAKIFEKYDFSAIGVGAECELQVKIFHKPSSDPWKIYRLLLNIGNRLEKQSIKMKAGTFGIMDVYDPRVSVMTFRTTSSPSQVEEALHSIYLWMEWPEKYS